MQQQQSDDNDILVGWDRMAAFAQGEGFKITKSTISKKGSPAIGEGPELIGYFGHQPTSTKGRMRAWLQAQLRPERPPSKRWARAEAVESGSIASETRGATRRREFVEANRKGAAIA